MSEPVAVSRPPARLTDIQVSLKVEAQLMESLSLGEAWVAPPLSIRASAQGASAVVDARADMLDTRGMPLDASPEWTSTDSQMVTVSPREGNEVQITVRLAGQSSVIVTSQRVSRELSIMAWYQNGAIHAKISPGP